jgi:hypothetical protein
LYHFDHQLLGFVNKKRSICFNADAGEKQRKNSEMVTFLYVLIKSENSFFKLIDKINVGKMTDVVYQFQEQTKVH